jgi:hypothetical protein
MAGIGGHIVTLLVEPGATSQQEIVPLVRAEY